MCRIDIRVCAFPLSACPELRECPVKQSRSRIIKRLRDLSGGDALCPWVMGYPSLNVPPVSVSLVHFFHSLSLFLYPSPFFSFSPFVWSILTTRRLDHKQHPTYCSQLLNPFPSARVTRMSIWKFYYSQSFSFSIRRNARWSLWNGEARKCGIHRN